MREFFQGVHWPKTCNLFCYRYIPVLMSQAKIYWDRDNYAQVEKVRVNYGPTSTVVDWQASRVGHMAWRIGPWSSDLCLYSSTILLIGFVLHCLIQLPALALSVATWSPSLPIGSTNNWSMLTWNFYAVELVHIAFKKPLQGCGK